MQSIAILRAWVGCLPDLICTKLNWFLSQPASNVAFPILSKWQLYPSRCSDPETLRSSDLSANPVVSIFKITQNTTASHHLPPLHSSASHRHLCLDYCRNFLIGLLCLSGPSMVEPQHGSQWPFYSSSWIMPFLCADVCRVYTFWPSTHYLFELFSYHPARLGSGRPASCLRAFALVLSAWPTPLCPPPCPHGLLPH